MQQEQILTQMALLHNDVHSNPAFASLKTLVEQRLAARYRKGGNAPYILSV